MTLDDILNIIANKIQNSINSTEQKYLKSISSDDNLDLHIEMLDFTRLSNYTVKILKDILYFKTKHKNDPDIAYQSFTHKATNEILSDTHFPYTEEHPLWEVYDIHRALHDHYIKNEEYEKCMELKSHNTQNADN